VHHQYKLDSVLFLKEYEEFVKIVVREGRKAKTNCYLVPTLFFVEKVIFFRLPIFSLPTNFEIGTCPRKPLNRNEWLGAKYRKGLS